MKRAQISLFMFMAVILLVIIFIFSSSSKPNIIVPKQTLDSSTLTEYIQTCFLHSAKESLQLLGKQGGLLYNYQAPGLPFSISPYRSFPISFGDNKYNVTYSIYAPTF